MFRKIDHELPEKNLAPDNEFHRYLIILAGINYLGIMHSQYDGNVVCPK